MNRQEKIRMEKRRVRDRERSFWRMTPARRRVAIAKDVIRMLRERKIVPRHCYLNFGGAINISDNRQVRDALVEKGMPSCSACAIGALMAATVMRTDRLTCGEAFKTRQEDIHAYLKRFFPLRQLKLMEIAYEGRGNQVFDFAWASRQNAIDFYEKFPDDDWYSSNDMERMTAIMENVIANGGQFKP